MYASFLETLTATSRKKRCLTAISAKKEPTHSYSDEVKYIVQGAVCICRDCRIIDIIPYGTGLEAT